LVKMPPPSRAKTEISEPPKPRPMRASTASLSVEPVATDYQHAGDRAALEGDVKRRSHPAAGGLGHP
jgi:hypothetical protein